MDTTKKKIVFSPDTLEGKLYVTAYFVPKIQNLPDVLRPYIVNMAVAMLGKAPKRVTNERRN